MTSALVALNVIARHECDDDNACPRYVRLSWAMEGRDIRLYASDGAKCLNGWHKRRMGEGAA